jgi:hypothetical protein
MATQLLRAVVGGLLLCLQPAVSADVNVAPAVCQVPFGFQSQGLRWNENFLMNPSWNVDTWVICPVTFDHGALPDLFVAAVAGSVMGGASTESPSCFFTINSAENTGQLPYRTGNSRALTWTLDFRFRPDTEVWTTSRQINKTLIPGQVGNAQLWAASFFCKLPTGYSISQLRLSRGSNFGG